MQREGINCTFLLCQLCICDTCMNQTGQLQELKMLVFALVTAVFLLQTTPCQCPSCTAFHVEICSADAVVS